MMKTGRTRKACLLLALMLCALPLFAAGGESAPAAAAAPAQAGSILRTGSQGEEVKRLQERLAELGYDPGKADGAFGRKTKMALQSFQKQNGLTQDGEAGPETLARLYSDEAAQAPEPIEADVLAGELPMLVNKDHPLEEMFYPKDLVRLKDVLPSKLVKIKYKDTRAVREAAEAVKSMLEAAKADGITKWQISNAYRSYAQQENTLNNKINTLLKQHKGWKRSRARGAALQTVALPGCSEHQLGLAFDINVPGVSSFAGTRQCKWLHEHCWEYGFIVRYTKEKEAITGFLEEAWHIRYVGKAHALKIRELGLCLEEYLEGIADGSILPPAPEEEPAENPAEVIQDEILLDDDAA